MYAIQNLGLTVPGQQKAQGYYNSVGTSMGLGKRHEPLDGVPVENPGVGNYDVGKDADNNDNPQWKFGTSIRKDPKRPDWPGPGDTKVPEYTTHGRKITLQKQELNQATLQQLREQLNRKDDGIGPGTYTIKVPNTAPIHSFGTRFNSSIRNKDHVRPQKKDGPGPGAYKLPSSVKVVNKPADAVNRGTFGTAGRNFIDLPKDTPAPNKYRPVHMTEAAHSYSIAAPPDLDYKEHQINKQKQLPGPGQYKIHQKYEMGHGMNLAKSMLGGSTQAKEDTGNGVPGPQAYTQNNPNISIPGFIIKQDTTVVLKEQNKNKEPLGPQRYRPNNPCHTRTDFLKNGHSIGNAERPQIVQAVNAPGPGKYNIDGDFEKAQTKPKFHMGIKTMGFVGKNLDMPGPGEYETDVQPIHHSNVAHFIGTSVRSDLGVGKAYMYPGPGEYEAQIDSQMDPRIRIAGTFGTQKKDTVIKKTFAPGPGSYDLPASVGLMPQYLRTEENQAAKAAQEAALRARLEI